MNFMTCHFDSQDTKFTIVLDPENSWIGGDFVVDLKMKNISKEKRTVGGRINVCSEYYTGVLGDKLKSEPFKNIVIPPGKGMLVARYIKFYNFKG